MTGQVHFADVFDFHNASLLAFAPTRSYLPSIRVFILQVVLD